MTNEQLREIINKHKLWLDNKGGKIADLCGADLRRANFRKADLRKANLSWANLSGANFSEANFNGANLNRANLHKADFWGSKNLIQWQSPQGKKRICYSVKHDTCVMHKLGCHWGDTEATVEAIRKKYGENSLYERYVWLACQSLAMENNDD